MAARPKRLIGIVARRADRSCRRRAPGARAADARDASAAAHRVARAGAHRDAVRHRRRAAGGRRQQLRRVPAGGEVAAARRRAARSGHRAHPVAAAGPGRRLRLADGPAGAARARRHPRRSATGTAGSPASSSTMRELGDGDRPRRRRPSALARDICRRGSTPSARACRDGRGRARCSSSSASRRRCASIYVSGGVGFLHDMLEIAGGVNVFADVAARVGAAVDRDAARARAGRHPRSSRDRTARAGDDRRRAKRVWGALASVPAVQQRARPLPERRLPRRARAARSRRARRRSRARFIPDAFK